MNNWPYEFTAEYHRQRILEEVEQIRLERLTQKFYMDRPHFGRILFYIGDWMISIGRQLQNRSSWCMQKGEQTCQHKSMIVK